MSKVAVVYWSSTGNTEAMANAVAEGAKAAGAEVFSFESADFSANSSSDSFSIFITSIMNLIMYREVKTSSCINHEKGWYPKVPPYRP